MQSLHRLRLLDAEVLVAAEFEIILCTHLSQGLHNSTQIVDIVTEYGRFLSSQNYHFHFGLLVFTSLFDLV